MDYRIISIGALSHHELWEDVAPPRTAHATTTLIRSGDQLILVDPGLPGPILNARLDERAGKMLASITDVFLTNFRPAHRRGLEALTHARWHVSEMERETIGRQLIEMRQQEQEAETKEMIDQDIALLKRCQAAPDRLAERVDLFPLPGYTDGTCGLLLSPAHMTVLVAGDAIATGEHLNKGKILRGANDLERSRESLREVVEIADVIIPGHDNLIINNMRQDWR